MGYAVGVAGTILKTIDGGMSWSTYSSGPMNGLRGVTFTDANTGYIVGANGCGELILKTIDAGTTWIPVYIGTGATLNSICFPDPYIGYAVGAGTVFVKSIILKTMDGGLNWSNLPCIPDWDAGWLMSVFFTNTDVGYVLAAGKGIIFKTTDGGLSWVKSLELTPKQLFSVYFTDENTGYCAGGDVLASDPRGIILKTTDAGQTWSSIPITHNLNSVFFADANTGYAAGGGDYPQETGVVYKTNDAGTTWNELSKQTPHPLNAVFFLDASTGYVAGDFGIILKTTDGGSSWTTLPTGSLTFFSSLFFPTQNTGYAVGDDGIYKTLNGGLTWTVDSSGTWNGFTSVFFTDSTTGYVAGNWGTILKTGYGGETGVEPLPPQKTSFTLYPNPAENKIKITTTKSIQEEISVIILTVSGVRMLNDSFRNSNQIEMDISNLLPGIYLVKIQTGDGVEVKKLMVE